MATLTEREEEGLVLQVNVVPLILRVLASPFLVAAHLFDRYNQGGFVCAMNDERVALYYTGRGHVNYHI